MRNRWTRVGPTDITFLSSKPDVGGDQAKNHFDCERVIPSTIRPRNAPPMTQGLAAFSASIVRLVAAATPLLSAIRVGPNRDITGLICQGDTILTTDQALPILDSYTAVLANRLLVAARPGPRDPNTNLALLRLETPFPANSPEIATAAVGSVAVVLGADSEASPTVRLTVVHRFIRAADGLAPVLDLSGDHIDPGSLVLDADGRLIGLAALGPNSEAIVIPSTLISRMVMPNQPLIAPSSTPPLHQPPRLARGCVAADHGARSARGPRRPDLRAHGGQHYQGRTGRTCWSAGRRRAAGIGRNQHVRPAGPARLPRRRPSGYES
jgi:hypothetical protein